jgi:hypothetical protein
MCETNQISGGTGWDEATEASNAGELCKANLTRTGRRRPWRAGPGGLPLVGPIMRNEANLSRSEMNSKCFLEKEL